MPKIIRQRYYIGIDPGLTGGLAWVDSKGQNGECIVMPKTERDIYYWLDGCPPGTIAEIEKSWARPNNASSRAFKFGSNYGFLRGCLICCEFSFTEPTPQQWQKDLSIPSKKKNETPSSWKNRLKAFAQQLYPKIDVPLKAADSLLIAEHCRRKNEGLL